MGTPEDTSEAVAEPLIRWRRWVPLFVILVALLCLWQIDLRLKRSDSPGFVVSDADWAVVADDVGRVWSGFIETETWGSLRGDFGDPSRDALVELRKRFGIRLSPQRWNTWLGEGATLSGNETVWLLVTRPGVLMRVGMGLFPRAFSDAEAGYSFAWHEGYLCVSDSGDLLNLVKEGGVSKVRGVGIRDGLRISVPDFHNADVTLFARDGIPLEGRIDLIVPEVPGGLSLRDDADLTIVQISSANPEPVLALLTELLPNWPNLQVAHEIFGDWFERVPEGWRDRSEESVWALDGISMPEYVAVPLVEQAKLGRDAVGPDSLLSRRFERAGLSGFCEPWLGHTYERCVVSDDALQRVSNNAAVFEEAPNRWQFGVLDAADVRIELKPLGLIREFGPVARSAAVRGDIEGWNSEDVNDFIDTYTRRIQNLGRVVLTGRVQGERVAFVGLLDASDE